MKLSHQNDNFFTYRGLEETKINGISIEQFITNLSTDKLKFASFLQHIKLQKKSKVFLLRLFSGEPIPEMKIDEYKEIGKDIVSHFENISIENIIKFSFMRELFSNLSMSEIEMVKVDIEEEIVKRFYDFLTKHFSQLGIHSKLQEKICSDFEQILPRTIVKKVQENIAQVIDQRSSKN